MTYLKINGFHTQISGRAEGIGQFLRDLDAARVPFFAYCVDGTTSLVDAQNIIKKSDVEHNAMFRRATFPHNQGGTDVPDYNFDPKLAAARQWASHVEQWPRELDPAIVWGETVNELDGNDLARADWIGEFCHETARLALESGRKWGGPGFASGTPDLLAWETPGMLKFLALAAKHPDRLAVTLHEYAYSDEDIMNGDGFLVGRFRFLLQACKRHNIPAPTIFFTEWGWNERSIPATGTAIEHIRRAGELYAQYPSVKGAAVWTLGGGWGDIANKVHGLMPGLQKALIETRYGEPAPDQPQPQPDPERPAPGRHAYKVRLLPQDTTRAEYEKLLREMHGEPAPDQPFRQRNDMVFSHDAAYAIAYAGNERTRVIVYDPQRWDFPILEYFAERGIATEVATLSGAPVAFKALAWPTDYFYITQPFGANPENYREFGFDGHEGIDLFCPIGKPYKAIAAGTVIRVSDRRSDGATASNYGWHVIVDHGSGVTSLYAHAAPGAAVSVGQRVEAGQVLAYSGNTGRSSGAHLHLTLKVQGAQTKGYPAGYIDPFPALQHLYYVDPAQPRMTGFLWQAGLDLFAGRGRALGNLNLRDGASRGARLLRVVLLGEAVKVTGAPVNGYLPVEVTSPQADESAAIDMAQYFRPAHGAHGLAYRLVNNWGEAGELTQLQLEGNRSYTVKNAQYEERVIGDRAIYLVKDTSRGNGEYYTVESAQGWLPRFWRPGETHKRHESVKVLRKENCRLVKEYPFTSDLRFAALHKKWQGKHGIELSNVAEIHWLVNGRIEEAYFYAPGLGLVQWRAYSNGKIIKESSIQQLDPIDHAIARERGCFS